MSSPVEPYSLPFSRPACFRGFGGVAVWVGVVPIGYDDAVAAMEARVAGIAAGAAREALWFLEHAPVYTGGSSVGSSGGAADIRLDAGAVPVRHVGRGGQWTYHAPGQRIIYIMLNLRERGQDVRAFIRGIEAWVIAALSEFGIAASPRQGAPGVWLARADAVPNQKIAAIGVRLTRWVSWHGVAINVDAKMLQGFQKITPCGIADTETVAINSEIKTPAETPKLMHQLDTALETHFPTTLGNYMRFSG